MSLGVFLNLTFMHSGSCAGATRKRSLIPADISLAHFCALEIVLLINSLVLGKISAGTPASISYEIFLLLTLCVICRVHIC